MLKFLVNNFIYIFFFIYRNKRNSIRLANLYCNAWCASSWRPGFTFVQKDDDAAAAPLERITRCRRRRRDRRFIDWTCGYSPVRDIYYIFVTGTKQQFSGWGSQLDVEKLTYSNYPTKNYYTRNRIFSLLNKTVYFTLYASI